jgi:tetratricopeptide (TPR) repeat protein
LGVLYREMQRRVEAEALLKKALDIREHLVRSHPDVVKYQDSLGSNYHNLGVLYRETGRPVDAEKTLQRALEIAEQLARDHPKVPDYRVQVAARYEVLGLLYLKTRRPTQAEAAYQKALGIREQMARDHAKIPSYQNSVAASYNNLANLYLNTGRPDDAEAAYEKALAIRAQLAREYSQVAHYQNWLAHGYNNLAMFHRDIRKQRQESKALFQKAIPVWERLTREDPKVPEYRHELAKALSNVSLLHKEAGQFADAEAACRQALALWEQLTHDYPEEYEYALIHGRNHGVMGAIMEAAGQLPAALDWHAQRIDALEALARQGHRDGELRHLLVRARLAHALTLARVGEHARATAEAASIAKQESVPDGTLYDLACVYALSSVALRDATKSPSADKPPLAEQYARRAIELLAQAREAGFFKNPRWVAHLKKDTDLDALHARDDYRKLLAELEADTKREGK